MFERFTDQARRVVVLAQEEARMARHDHIGTEHLLLGIFGEPDGAAATALESVGISEQAVREQVAAIAGPGSGSPAAEVSGAAPASTAAEVSGAARAGTAGHLPFSPQAKKALQLSLREAMHLGHGSIGTEHILLGLIRAGDGPALQVLARLGSDAGHVRQQVTELLSGGQRDDEPTAVRPAAVAVPAGRGQRTVLLSEVSARLDLMESRLSAVEHRVGVGPDLRGIDEQIAQVRRDKESAIDVQEYEEAALLRDREKQLLADKAARQRQWAAEQSGLASLTDDVQQLRNLLRQHGIDPRDGAA